MIRHNTFNHRDHSLTERENYFHSFDKNDTPHVLLQTCNRIEVYWGEGEIPEQTVRHLFRVASGLESSLIGERAIQGQVKAAYREACKNYTLSPSLHRLFQWAVHTGKQVRARTGISQGAVSHSQATAQLIDSLYDDLSGKIITLIGVNKVNDDILKYLKSKGANTFFLANRNFSKAEEWAGRYGCTALPLAEKKKFLAFTDILICATSAPHPIIYCDDIAAGKEMTVCDLSFPRNVEVQVSEIPKITMFDLESIEAFIHGSITNRNNQIGPAESLIENEIKEFMAWFDNYEKHTKNRYYGKESIPASL